MLEVVTSLLVQMDADKDASPILRIHSKAHLGSYIQRKVCIQIVLFLLLQKFFFLKRKKDVLKLQSEFIYSEERSLLEEPLTTVLHKTPSHFVSLILCI